MKADPHVTPGRILGVDYGTRRIGLAVSDADRRIASPLANYTRRDAAQDGRYFQKVVSDEKTGQLVVGLPVHTTGTEGQKAVEARTFASWLAEVTGLPVVFWDERFTTADAEQLLLAAGLTSKRRKERLDKVAAQILLQSYLDAGCPAAPDLRPLEDPPDR